MKNNTFNDGANWQAQAVAAYVSYHCNITTDYKAKVYEPEIARWYNCREQGYIISQLVNYKQINIVFFEHRNSDSICAVIWEQKNINPLTIDNAEFGNVYKHKYDVSYSAKYGMIVKMGEWICDQLNLFVEENKQVVE